MSAIDLQKDLYKIFEGKDPVPRPEVGSTTEKAAIPLDKRGNNVKYTFDNIYEDKALARVIKDYYFYKKGSKFESDEDAINEYISDSTFRQSNTLGAISGDLSLNFTSNVPERQKQNLSYLINYWHNLPNFYEEGGRGFKGFMSNLGYALLDPLNIIGGGVGGFVARKTGQKVIQEGLKQAAKQKGKKLTPKDLILKNDELSKRATKLGRKKLLTASAAIAGVDATGLAISDIAAQTTEKEINLINNYDPMRTGLVAVAGAGFGFFVSAGTGYGTKVVLENINRNKIKLPKTLENTITKTSKANDEGLNAPANPKSRVSLYKTKLVDQHDYFKVLQEEFEGIGGSVADLKKAYYDRGKLPKKILDKRGRVAKKFQDPISNPYFMLRLTAASATKANEYIMSGYYRRPALYSANMSPQKTGKPGLNQVLKPFDETGEIPIFLQYAGAKRQRAIVNYNKKKGRKSKGLPYTDKEVEQLIDFGEMSPAAYKAKYKEDLTRKGDYKLGLRQLKLFTDDALRDLIDAEVISPQMARDFLEANPVFVPLYRTNQKSLFKSIQEQTVKMSPIGASARKRFAQQKLEGELNIYDNIVNYVYKNVAAADRNVAKLSLYDMFSRAVRNGKLKGRFNKKGDLIEVQDLDGNTLFKKVTPSVEQVSAITDSAIKALERGGLRVIGKTLNDKDTVDIAAFAGTVKKIGSENVLDIVYRKGKPEYYEIVDKNFVAAYQSIGDNVSNVVNFLQTGFFAKYTRLASRAITYSPPFIAFNAIRDTLSGVINSAFGITASKLGSNAIGPGFIPVASTAKGVVDAYRLTDVYRQAHVSGMGYSSRIDAEKALKSATDNILEYGKSDLSRFYVNSLSKIYGKTLGAGWAGYKDFVSKVEYGTRFAEYNLAKKAGFSDMGAAFAGREVATDFGMKGSSVWLNTWSRNTMFFNAGIQGLYRGGRILVEQPKRAVPLILATVVLPDLLLHNLNKEYDEYNQLDPRIKQLNYLFPDFSVDIDPETKLPKLNITGPEGKGTGFFAVPKPYDFGFAGNIFIGIQEGIEKKSSYLTQKYFLSSLMNILPSVALPTPVNPLLELMIGYNFYTGRPVESFYSVTNLNKMRKHGGTRVIAEKIANLTANLKGTVAADGKEVDYAISPITVDYLIRAYFAGMLQYIPDVAEHMLYESTMKDIRGPKPERRADEARIVENPLSIVTRRFRVETPLKNTKYHRDFYDLYSKAKKYSKLDLSTISDKRRITTKLDLFEKFIKDKKKFQETGKFQSDEVTMLSDLSPILGKVAQLLNEARDARTAYERMPNMSAIDKANKIEDILEKENAMIQTVIEQLALQDLDHVFENLIGQKTVVPSPKFKKQKEQKKKDKESTLEYMQEFFNQQNK